MGTDSDPGRGYPYPRIRRLGVHRRRSRVEVDQASSPGQPAFIEVSCLRGTSQSTLTLRAELRIPRAEVRSPGREERQTLRFGRQCPGPIGSAVPLAGPTTLVIDVGGEAVETQANIGVAPLRADQPIETHAETPCEIATYAVDPIEVRLVIEGRGETKARYLAELLMAEHRGEVVIDVPSLGARQSFPISGASRAIADIHRNCGWEDPAIR